MPKSIDASTLKLLKKAASLSIAKKSENPRSGAVAFSLSGKKYLAGLVESDTNTFDIPPEHAALMLSTISNDYKVSKIVAMVERATPQNIVSPLVLKLMKDHSIRTGIPIEYVIVDSKGKILFASKKSVDLIPFYAPEAIALSRTNQRPSSYVRKVPKEKKKLISTLKETAIEGLKKNFPLYESASGYATAVATKSGKIYFAGQYSSPDKRLGLHSEVNAILAALMNKEEKITHLGLVSTKYTDTPCHMCGNCRQFLTEMSEKFGFSPKLYFFAKDNDEHIETVIEEYLPSSWRSKNWKS